MPRRGEASRVELAAGQRRATTVLGTTARYRVVEVLDDLVRVEVISAPGLAPGTSLKLKADVLRRMALDEPGREAETASIDDVLRSWVA